MMSDVSDLIQSDSEDSSIERLDPFPDLEIPESEQEDSYLKATSNSSSSSDISVLPSPVATTPAGHGKVSGRRKSVLDRVLNEDECSLADSFKSAIGSSNSGSDVEEDERVIVPEIEISSNLAGPNQDSSGEIEEDASLIVSEIEMSSIVTGYEQDATRIISESLNDSNDEHGAEEQFLGEEAIESPGSDVSGSERSGVSEMDGEDWQSTGINLNGCNQKNHSGNIDYLDSEVKELVHSDPCNGDVNESIEEILEDGPKQSSLIDLTQSDSSLQNSPIGAFKERKLDPRNLDDIVREQSFVSHELMMNQNLLQTLNVGNLPDNGKNLTRKINSLQQRKIELDRELQENSDYKAQKAGFESCGVLRKSVPTKQTSLNFMPLQVKSEYEGSAYDVDYESGSAFNGNQFQMPGSHSYGVQRKPNQTSAKLMQIQVKGEAEDSELEGAAYDGNLSTMPNWGELPTADTTISHLGKKALQTHLTEKVLTVESLADLHKSLKSCPSEDTYAEDPAKLKVELLPHQKHGLAWLLWREKERPSGGILADDMGLGKTISMISLILKDIEMIKEKDPGSEDESSEDGSPPWKSSKHSRMIQGGTLVVCPASVVSQWEGEIYKRVKRRYLNVEVYHGPKRETRPRRLAQNDVVITTYALVSRESGADSGKNAYAKDSGPLFGIKWHRVILDEAHMVRNHKSLMAIGVCELEAKHRWCLTGTPIQNKELDLYALLKFLRCSPFDDLAVWKKWVDNKNAAGMQRLNTMMQSLMLRRTKQQLSIRGELDSLPEKSHEIIDVHLDPEELEVYEKVAEFSQTLFAQFLSQQAEKQQVYDARYNSSSRPVWEQGERADNQFATTAELAAMHRKMLGLSEVKSFHILVLLLRLRQICCHPGLAKKVLTDTEMNIDGAGVEDGSGLDIDLFDQMNNLNITESNMEEEENKNIEKQIKSRKLSENDPIFSFDRASAKIRAILDLIQEKIVDTDDKAIIVSQWTSMLDILGDFLKQMKVKVEALTGQVPVHKRQEIVYEFNKAKRGPQILLLSMTAGGVGLNLMGANHLLLIDIHWNPQLEAQACDRIYRIGQRKDVYIYKFITINTIEERVKMLQDKKLELADNVLTGTRNTQASKLTLDDLKMLFSVPVPVPKADIPS